MYTMDRCQNYFRVNQRATAKVVIFDIVFFQNGYHPRKLAELCFVTAADYPESYATRIPLSTLRNRILVVCLFRYFCFLCYILKLVTALFESFLTRVVISNSKQHNNTKSNLKVRMGFELLKSFNFECCL